MTNRFGLDLHPKEVRWAAAEGVSTGCDRGYVHERSVEEVVPQLSPLELEKVIVLVGRSPRLYPRGILEALEQHKSLPQPGGRLSLNAAAKEQTTTADRPRHAATRTETDANKMRLAHERRLEMLRAHTSQNRP